MIRVSVLHPGETDPRVCDTYQIIDDSNVYFIVHISAGKVNESKYVYYSYYSVEYETFLG